MGRESRSPEILIYGYTRSGLILFKNAEETTAIMSYVDGVIKETAQNIFFGQRLTEINGETRKPNVRLFK